MALQPGAFVGPYRIIAPLGAGGMGEVYRAHDARLNRDIAIKVLRADAAADDLQRFVREAQTLAALNHPHIAQIHGVEPIDTGAATHGAQAIVMELVEGEDLSARIARGPMPFDDVIDIGRQIADALEAAHEHGIVHRDLKPGNIKVRADGTVKVLDFGLAKGVAEAEASAFRTRTSPVMTQAGVILGTAAYMSPEQARGKTTDKRSDIWGFGVVLFEMLTGRYAFSGETVTDVLAGVISRDPEWERLPATLPPALQRLVRRCLEKDARMRLRDIGEARVTLSRAAAGDADFGAAIAAVGGSARRSGAAWLPWAVAAVATMVTVGSWMMNRAPELPLRKLELSLPANGQFTLSPDGRRMGARIGERIAVVDLERLERHDLATSSAPQRSDVFWSPDSAFVGFNDAEGKLWIVPAAGGPPRLVCVIPETRQLMRAAWRPDGSIVLAVWRGSLYTVPASGGEPAVLLRVAPDTEIDFHHAVALPDGKLLVTTHLRATGDQREEYRLEVLHDGARETALQGDFQAIGFGAGSLLVLRSDVNQGMWAIPYHGRLPLRIDDGFLVAPGAGRPTANDEALLYALSTEAPQARDLVWVDRTGQVVGQVGPSRVDLFAPSLSPDGRRVAFSSRSGDNHEVWVRDVQSHMETRVTSGPGARTLPSWFPTALRLAYSELGGIANQRVAASAVDGSGRRQELVRGFSGVVSPDGRYLAYLMDDSGDYRARAAPIAGDGSVGPSAPLLTIQPEPSIHGISFSADAKLLAYVERQPGGAMEVFVTRFPSREGRWQVSNGGGRAPVWSRRGELFFIAGSNDGPKKMMAAPVAAAMTPPAGSAVELFALREDFYTYPRLGTILFSGSPYDVSADGQRFLMVRAPGGSQSALRWILVQNWMAEFGIKR